MSLIISSSDSADRLMDAYRSLRAVYHRNALQDQTALVSDDQLLEERALVKEVWRLTCLGQSEAGDG